MKATFHSGGSDSNTKIDELIESFDLLDERKKAQREYDKKQKAAADRIQAELKDIKSKLAWRTVYYISLLVLLGGQNIFIYLLIWNSTRLEIDIKAISIVATATLAETYGLVTIIVKHLVKEIEYRSS
jgi:hypothetical protein